MTNHVLDDDRMVKMYNNNVLVSDMEKYFKSDRRTIYRHLRTKGIEPNRKVSPSWTPHEEMQLIDAVRNGATGIEYTYYVPTRTKTACKGHLRGNGT